MFSRTMLAALFGVAMLVGFQQANADVSVRGYYRSNGTYVAPHRRSDPDGKFSNNWSTYGNVNPYTGQYGTRRTPSPTQRYYNPYYTPRSYRSGGSSW